MKSKILFPVLGFALIGAVVLYNQNVFSNVKAGKMSASLLDDNPNNASKKVLNPFPDKIKTSSEQVFREEIETNATLRELVTKDEVKKAFLKSFPESFDCKELSYEIDLHNQNPNAPRYDMKYKKEVKAEELANVLNMYDNPFIFTQLYNRNNISLTNIKGNYLYDEHFPENKPEEQAYLVKKVSHLLPVFNDSKEIQYLHFNVYARHVERGVYETYENYVVKYNDDGTINHVVSFSKSKLTWTKLNYDSSSKLAYVDNIYFYQYGSENGKGKRTAVCDYYKIQVQEKS
jgi:hypothetical protein